MGSKDFFSISGNVAVEENGLPFRVHSDLQILSYQKVQYRVCELLRKLAIEQGMGEVALEDHIVKQRFHAVSCKHFNFQNSFSKTVSA